MKKLVAIALIAAMASVANAGISLVASGTDRDAGTAGLQVFAGDTVTISLVTTGDNMAGGFQFGVLSDFGANGAVSGVTYTTGLAGTQSFSVINAGEILNTAAGIGFPSGVAGTSALIYSLALQANASLLPGTWLTMSYAVNAAAGAGDIVIGGLSTSSSVYYMYSDGESWNDQPATVANMNIGGTPTDVSIGDATMTVIPEPMTLGLLGLGGLFLRRRLA